MSLRLTLASVPVTEARLCAPSLGFAPVPNSSGLRLDLIPLTSAPDIWLSVPDFGLPLAAAPEPHTLVYRGASFRAPVNARLAKSHAGARTLAPL